MTEHINWIAVLVAALATFVVGGPWYSPAMFLKPWHKAMNMSDAKPGHPARVFGLAFVFSVVSCAALACLLEPGADLMAGLKLGLLVGIAFVAASFGINYQFSNRPPAALFIDGGYHIVQFAAFGAILGAWPG